MFLSRIPATVNRSYGLPESEDDDQEENDEYVESDTVKIRRAIRPEIEDGEIVSDEEYAELPETQSSQPFGLSDQDLYDDLLMYGSDDCDDLI